MSAEFWITQALNALQLSMLLFLLSIGLTVIFGLLNFVNLAHGALYALGAFVGVEVLALTGSYAVAVLIAPLAVGAVGVALYFGLIRWMRSAGPLFQVLVTFGLIFISLDLFRMIWGDFDQQFDKPALLSGPVSLMGLDYPAYNLFVILIGGVTMLALWSILSFTSIGAMIRACVENRAMASAMGINVERVFVGVFCVGCALAGLAGVVAAPNAAINPPMGIDILIPTLIVVVIGGLGSLKGAIVGSLLIGFVQTFGAVFSPVLAGVVVYALLAAVLIFKPSGLFPARA